MVGVVTLITINRLRQSRSLVRHTLLVLERSAALRTHLSDTETGQRGFLLTNEERYLEPYSSGRAAIERDTADLRALVTDNPDQQNRLDLLADRLRAKIGELERTIAYRRAGKPDSAFALVETDSGKVTMDSIRRIIDRFDAEERRLFEQRDARADRLETGRVSTVTLSAVSSGEAVRIHVADTGRGIAPSRHHEIFEPFVQVDRHLTRDGEQGIGLGLAISRELARAMNGDLTVESETGTGATFTVQLKAV